MFHIFGNFWSSFGIFSPIVLYGVWGRGNSPVTRPSEPILTNHIALNAGTVAFFRLWALITNIICGGQ